MRKNETPAEAAAWAAVVAHRNTHHTITGKGAVARRAAHAAREQELQNAYFAARAAR